MTVCTATSDIASLPHEIRVWSNSLASPTCRAHANGPSFLTHLCMSLLVGLIAHVVTGLFGYDPYGFLWSPPPTDMVLWFPTDSPLPVDIEFSPPHLENQAPSVLLAVAPDSACSASLHSSMYRVTASATIPRDSTLAILISGNQLGPDDSLWDSPSSMEEKGGQLQVPVNTDREGTTDLVGTWGLYALLYRWTS